MKRGIRGELSGILPPELVGFIPRSFDIIGSKGRAIAIIEITPELEPYGKAIGEALMRVQGNVRSVLSKGTERMGGFRVREMTLAAGDPNTEVIHKESGNIFKVDPVKAYFSPRESTEREKISSQVSHGERVLVMFSGVGPFAICIAKRQSTGSCVAVEFNPDCHRYCVENIRLNKVGDRVTAILGDVREVCPTLGERFDRVLMPLPKGAYKYLDVAITDDPFTEGERILLEAVEKAGRGAEITDRVRVSQYSPSAWKIRLDARII
jgi:tRNA (guanine37-N1)-methyltransferase